MGTLQKITSDWPEKDRCATLSIDAMKLSSCLRYEEHIDHVNGFEDVGFSRSDKVADEGVIPMLRGVCKTWKQPIGYYFIRNSMKQDRFQQIINELLTKCHEIGIIVVALVCDQETTKWAMITRLTSLEQPYLIHPVTGDSVFVITDVPHLLKSTRNNLMKYDIQYDDNGKKRIAKWTHITQFWEKETACPIQFAPKLSQHHFSLSGGMKMKVNLAAQIFSRTTAAGMKTRLHYGELSEDVLDTIKFIEQISDIFDMMNSISTKEGGPKRSIYAHELDCRLIEMKLCVDWCGSWIYLKSTGKLHKTTMTHKKGWLLSISAMADIVFMLVNKYNFRFVLTRKFTQDHVENCFSSIRGKNGFNDNPEYQAFLSAAKSMAVSRLITPTSKAKKCIDDDSELLVSLPEQGASDTDGCSTTMPLVTIVNYAPPQNQEVTSQELMEVTSCEEEIIHYIAGNAVRAILRRHECQSCVDTFSICFKTGVFLQQKDFKWARANSTGLTSPSVRTTAYLTTVEQIFRQNIDMRYVIQIH